MNFLNFFNLKKEKKKNDKIKENINEETPKTWYKVATVTINENIVYRYSCGDYSKFIDGKRVRYTSGGGWYYEDFIKQVFNDYPPEKVTLLKIVCE